MSETRARKRIRKAVESRGYHVLGMEWEPWSPGAEKEGIHGGWLVLTDHPWLPNTNYGDEISGLSVEEVLACADHDLKPSEPCACPGMQPRTIGLIRHPLIHLKGDPEEPLHDRGCRWFIDYRLPWWPPGVSGVVAEEVRRG